MSRHADWGPLIVETDVDADILLLLRTWLPTYLGRVEDERGEDRHALARPVEESYANALEDDEFLDYRLPSIVVTTAAPVGTPERDGNGLYSAAWSVVVSAILRGKTPPEARRDAALFGGCVRRILVQQALPTLPGAVEWAGGRVAPVMDTTGADRFLAAGVNTFTVNIDDVLDADGGPAGDPYPDPDPTDPDTAYTPLATVEAVNLHVDGRPIIEGD
jgi:hypothetical protein